MTRSIVVTGLGAVSALGPDVASNWATALAGEGAIALVAYPPPNASAKETVIPTAKLHFDPQPALEAALGHRVGVIDPSRSTPCPRLTRHWPRPASSATRRWRSARLWCWVTACPA